MLVFSILLMTAGAVGPVPVTIESTLATAGENIRALAFDGDAKTYFLSEKHAAKDDSFTLTFDKPVTLKSLKVLTGKPDGTLALAAGELEVSTDGKAFTKLAVFADGAAEAKPGAKALAVRVRATAAQETALAIREFTIDSDPPLMTIKHPVEFVLDVSDAPEMKEWAAKMIRVCERQYTMLNEELASEGFAPRKVIHVRLKKDYKGVAAAGNGRITGSVDYFKAHPDDIGAFVHETAHVVQNYRTRNNPGWLVEGIADYVRFFKYEEKKPKPLAADRAKYDGSYRTSAAFLDFLCTTYDKDIVKKLNKAMREGEYSADLFKLHTKKTLAELDEEWKKSLRK